MSNEIAEKVEDAQRQLHKAVIEALDEFTHDTGMCVYSMEWMSSNVLDSNGHTQAVEYWHMQSSLRTGVS